MTRDALVVGISAYQWLPSLSAPAVDAEAIAQQLQTNGDFRVTRMPDIIQDGQSRVGMKTSVTLAELESALVRLFKPKGSNVPHTALFYFSGHGLQKDAGIQEGYLVTSDANPNAGFYGLSLFWLRRLLQESPVRQRIILLDCCHSGELLNFLEADPGARAGTDRLFMAASREYEIAYESIEGKYSVFTQALIDGLDPRRVSNGTVTNYALTDWVSNALKGETQQPLFENSGSEIVLTRCQVAQTIIKTELSQEVCPYRGLECFDEAHAEYFFGREELTDQLIEKLKSRNFVAIVGASGSGKSSLVRAGLIHQLRQGHKFSGSDRWRIQLITPTEHPLRSLASAFVNSKAPTIDRAEHLQRAEALLREGGNGLSHLVRASLISSKSGRNSRLLLIIDQFEEVFTLCGGTQAERDRHRFFNALLTALQEASDCLSIVIALRADFFGKCSLYNGLAEQIEQNLVTATPLTYEQIKASVVKPAQKSNAACEPNLVYNILLDVVGAPGELPLLQYTLMELWQQRQPDPNGGPDRLTLNAYTELGGVRGTLQKRADAIFYSLSEEEQQVAKRIFIALTQLGEGTEDTRRRILKSELVSSRFPAELVDQVLEKLVTAKLIITNQLVSTSRHQERIDRGLAGVSTALRLTQITQSKVSRSDLAPEVASSKAQVTTLEGEYLINRVTHLPTSRLAERNNSHASFSTYQEVIDVAHEALIRNWTLLRTWLDENREMLRRQRRIEHAAREWQAAEEPRSNDYLLHGDRLIDAEDYLKIYPDELSALAQRFVAISREENRRTQKELRLLQLVVPCTMLVALVVTFTQYMAAIKSQGEKDYQLQIATSRQQAAIAQSILQDPDGDPMAALLISRLAVEKGERTYEAQASLRAALQKLRLQVELRGHRGPVHQVAFSPDQHYVATAGEDGTIRLWSLKTQSIERVLQWDTTANTKPPIISIAFSPDGKRMVAIAQDSNQAQIWSVESGALQSRLDSQGKAMTQLAFSPDGKWIATADANRTVNIWQADSGKLQKSFPHAFDVRSIAFSPDGNRLLTASGNNVLLRDVSTGRSLQTLHHLSKVNSAVFSADGLKIASASQEGTVYLWQANSRRLTHNRVGAEVETLIGKQLHTGSRLLSQLLFSPNGQTLAAVDQNHQVWVWDVSSGLLRLKQTNELSGEEDKGLGAIAFSPDSQRLVTSGLETSSQSPYVIRLWNLQSKQLIETLRGHSSVVESIQFSGDGSLIATASADGTTRLWASEPGSEFPKLKLAGEQVQWVAFREPSSRQSFDLSNTATAAVRSTHSVDPKLADNPSSRSVNELVAVTNDGTVHNWSLPPLPLPAGSPNIASSSIAKTPLSSEGKGFGLLRWVGEAISFLGLRSQTKSLDWDGSSTRTKVASFSQESLNGLLTAPEEAAQPTSVVAPQHLQSTSEMTRSFAAELPKGTKLTGVAFSADTQLAATANSLGSIELWKLQSDGTVSLIRHLSPLHSADDSQAPTAQLNSSHRSVTIRQLAFSPEKQKLLGVGDDRMIYLWDVQSGKLIIRLKGHSAAIEQARFSPDGQLVVSASRDRTARLWSASTGELLNTLTHRNGVSSAQFSLDGQRIVTASLDGTARVLDAATGAIRVLLTGNRGALLDGEFSPDGQMLVTANADGTASLWDAQTGSEQALLRPAEVSREPIQRAFFSSDGRYVGMVSNTGKLYVWVTTWDGLLTLARDRSLRQLRPEECLRYLHLPPNACPTLDIKQEWERN